MANIRATRGGGLVDDTTFIDPTAFIAATAVVGARCFIGAGVYIDAGAVIGNDVQLCDISRITSGVSVGNRTVIGCGVVQSANIGAGQVVNAGCPCGS